MLNEFNIINQYFNPKTLGHPEIIQGIGDDAAVWQCEGATLVTSVDTLVEGHHFSQSCAPEDIAYKSLAVNLSDFAAMGATPRWFTLALTLPHADETWLEKFSKSLFALASEYDVILMGGDTTKGPLSITIQVIGTVDKNKMLLRSGAQIGDLIYVSGTIGDAGFALKNPGNKALDEKLNRPTPQVTLGLALAGNAHAAIDISDGLAQDLNHILTASHKGADIYLEKLPLSAELTQALSRNEAENLALSSGDDYQLCFTAPPNHLIIQALSAKYQLTCIGEITQTPGLRIHRNGQLITPKILGWQHF
ncbi:MAG: thiamine-phosphate kinase [Gammaproteobacteria bacterium]|jgi:thiamine-monophosphate kinase